jgi:hypothetical protein
MQVRHQQQKPRYPPLWNFKTLIYIPQKQKQTSTVQNLSLSKTYNKPNWQWFVTNSYVKSQALTQFVSTMGSKNHHQRQGTNHQQLPSSRPHSNHQQQNTLVQKKATVWETLSSITSSQGYKSFLKVEIANKSSSQEAGSGVTVAVTKPAVQMTGDQKLRRLRLILDSFPITRGEIQIMFHEKFIQSCLPIIYRGEWDYNFDAIMRRNRITQIFLERILICPRRFGKSVGVALFAAAFFWSKTKKKITIFSRGKRMAQKLMLQCVRFALSLPGFREYLVSCTTEKVELRFGNDDLRCLCCLPGSTEVCVFSLS